MFVAAGVSDVAIGVREKLRGKIGQTKVKRYWAGKRPEWVQDEESDDEAVPIADKQQQKQQRQDSKEEVPPPSSSTVEAEDDPRLKRLAEHRRNREEAVARHREIRQAEIISTAVEVKPEVDETAAVIAVDGKKIELLVDETDGLRLQPDEDAVDEQRRRNKEKILQKLREEEMLARAAKQEEGEEDEEEEEEEEESEYETDSEEETLIPMIKPVFVKKTERDTIAERERLEAEEQALQEAQQKKLEERKAQSLQLMYEVIKKETAMETNKAEDAGVADVDTDDDQNPEEDYEAWKARELARIKRDKEQAETAAKEKEEIEKLRKMSEEERLEWEKKNPKPAPAPKGKQRYLQKYYHKGAFFQSDVNDNVMPGGTDIFTPSYARGENLCSQYTSPPQLCTPDPSVTVEETAKRAYQFYKAFVVDGDARTMFSFIDNAYIQHHPGYANGPQTIWPIFCNGMPVGSASDSAWCFDASTNMSYARYSVTDRWRWVDGCVHEHWDQGETIPTENCYKLNTTLIS